MDITWQVSQVAEWFHPLKISYTDTVMTMRKESWPYLLLPMAIVEGMVITSFFSDTVRLGVLGGIILVIIPPLVVLIGLSFSYVITVDKKKKIILVVERSLFLKSSRHISLEGFDCLTLDGEEADHIWRSPESYERKIVVNTKSRNTTILSTNKDHAYEIVSYLNEFLF